MQKSYLIAELHTRHYFDITLTLTYRKGSF